MKIVGRGKEIFVMYLVLYSKNINKYTVKIGNGNTDRIYSRKLSNYPDSIINY